MAKGKALLTEGEVRKFMKFANIPHLADNFLKEGSYMEEETYEEGMAPPMGEEEMPVAEEPPADMDMPEEEPPVDMDLPKKKVEWKQEQNKFLAILLHY